MKYLFFFVFLSCSILATAQKKKKPVLITSPDADSLVFSKTKYRLIGPWRGGRSAAVTGSLKNRNTFYFGATGGGVWKTTDAGLNWKNISDKYFGSTIGAVAIAASNDNIIYVGEGENTMRGNVSEGLGGIWKSEDAGRTWKNTGLKDGRHIIRLVIHPGNPDIVWAAVMGHLFGANKERGVYKTTDGGKTWKNVLFVNEQTGCSDLVMEPGNPGVLYAGMWRALRTPYSMESGGAGSGLWKSVDGGDTWLNISTKKGLPKGIWGIVGVAVAASNPDRLYTIVENANGGMFKSDDAGESWTLTSSDNNIRQRAWYYTKLFVDPKNQDLVWALNVGLMRSMDGGKTFTAVGTPHGDHHDLWIDPEDPARMIVADDGGAQVSFNNGSSWTTYLNQPTAQFYRVSTDNAFPYRILGAQQDNSTVRIKSRTYSNSISEADWQSTAGFESGYVVADPLNPDIVYGGNYGGYLSRLDHKTGENRAISVWPDNPIGAGADALKYRFQWNFPIFFSPHNPKRLYAAGNVLFASENEGQSWEAISPDLTTDDKSKQASSGGPITQDNTSVEYYCTIFTATESPIEKDLLWTGSDDGRVHVSKDGGKHWENVTPEGTPQWMMWNAVEADPFKKGAAYFVGTRYKLDDFTPYIYKTENYGKSWKLITKGINKMHFTRALRADKTRPGLLYAGTEYGMYISFDDGNNWKSFQLNLPEVPITDLALKENDLIVATQGRAFWMLDDLSMIQQLNEDITEKNLYIFSVNPSWRMDGQRAVNVVNAGMNPPNGSIINYYLKEVLDSAKVSITILDKNHKLLKTFATDSKENKIEVNKGINQFVWDMMYPPAEKIEGMILWNGVPGRMKAVPGNYYVSIKSGNDSSERAFQVKADPNYKVGQQDYEAQQVFLAEVTAKFNEVQKAIRNIRMLRTQVTELTSRLDKELPPPIKQASDSLLKRLNGIEESLYQTKAKSSQDVLNFPIKLNDKLSGVFNAANSANFAPSKQVREVYADLSQQADLHLKKLQSIIEKELPQFNQLIREHQLPFIGVKKE